MIREMRLKELGIVSKLWEEMVLEKKPEWKPRIDWWEEIALNLINTGKYKILVAVKDSLIVGFGDFFIWPEPATGEIHSVGQHIYVTKKFRKSWHGAGLLKRWFNESAAEKSKSIEMFSFYNETDRWERLGFSTVRCLMRKGVCHV